MSKAPTTYAQFYEAVGSGLTAWGSVEEAFRDVFTRLVACSITGAGMGTVHIDGFWVLGGVFFSSTNFRARLQQIDRLVARLIKDEALTKEWGAVMNRALELYKRRNVLAHGQVWGGERFATVIKYSNFDEGNRRKMDYQQVCAQTPSFQRFEQRVTDLAVAMNKWLAEHPRPPATLFASAAH